MGIKNFPFIKYLGRNHSWVEAVLISLSESNLIQLETEMGRRLSFYIDLSVQTIQNWSA